MIILNKSVIPEFMLIKDWSHERFFEIDLRWMAQYTLDHNSTLARVPSGNKPLSERVCWQRSPLGHNELNWCEHIRVNILRGLVSHIINTQAADALATKETKASGVVTYNVYPQARVCNKVVTPWQCRKFIRISYSILTLLFPLTSVRSL